MTEIELCELIIKECEGRGLLAHWCRDSRQCEGYKGFPHLVIVGPGGLIIREVKSADGETTAEQDLWAWAIRSTGENGQSRNEPLWQLWRPAQWPSEIMIELDSIS